MADETKDNKFSSTPEELDVHRSMVLWLFGATFFLVVVTTAVLLISKQTTILPIVVVAGMLGSFVSALNRIYAASDIFPLGGITPLLRNVNRYLIAYSSIPPLVGAISAALLYVIFASEILTGPFFPAFECKCAFSGCDEFETFKEFWAPKEAVDYAKAIVWGFVAGFSERFVPDILNRISSKGSEDSK